MKRIIALSLLLTGIGANAAVRPVDWIVAVVDADIVTFTEFMAEFRVAAARTGRSMDALTHQEKTGLANQVTEKLITESLLLQEAKRRGITVTPAEADEAGGAALTRMRSQFVDQNAYDRALAAEFTTAEKMRLRYREDAEKQLFRNKLIDREIRREIKLSDSDVLDAYQKRGDEVHVRHILVTDSDMAERVRRRLLDGENFEQIAGSIATTEAADLGWVKRGTLVDAFEAAAFELKDGGISKVVKTRYGYHVIELLGKRTVELPPLTDELREEIFNGLYASHFDRKIESFVEGLKTKAYLQLRRNALNPIY